MRNNLSGRWQQIQSDFGLDVPFCRGQEIPIKNCWHFSTDGNSVDILFQDDDDFRSAMNRVYVVVRKYNVIILAFCIMDTHVHFVLYGEYKDCDRFVHDYVKLTSMDISRKYGVSHKMEGVDISCQAVDTDLYLKTVICYVIKNPYAAGLAVSPWDYPWSSGALYFRKQDLWTSPRFLVEKTLRADSFRVKQLKELLKTNSIDDFEARIINGMVCPADYVAYELVEKIFKSARSFNYFLFRTKDVDVESRGGFISRLSVPIQEMRQHRDELAKELFGALSPRSLNMKQRLMLARTLKSKYQSSSKQIVRLCGLVYDEVKDLI